MKWKTAGESMTKERWEDKLNLYPKDKFLKFQKIRIVHDPMAVNYHSIAIMTQKKGLVFIPVTCPRYDPGTDTYKKGIKCSACDVMFKINGMKEGEKKKKLKEKIKNQTTFFAKAIIRSLQKAGKKYVRNIRVTKTVATALIELMDLALTDISDRYGKKVAKAAEEKMDIGHIKYGFDFLLKYNPNGKTPDSKYAVQFVSVTPLTKKEIAAAGKEIDPKVVKSSTNENIEDLLNKAGLSSLLGKSTDYNDADDDGDDEVDFSDMDGKELIAYIKENDLEEIFPLKKAKKLETKKLRSLLKKYKDKMAEKEEEDEDEDSGSTGPNLSEMDKDELLEFADENDIELSKKEKKLPVKKLRKFIENYLDNEDDGADDDGEDPEDDEFFDDSSDGDDDDPEDEGEDEEEGGEDEEEGEEEEEEGEEEDEVDFSDMDKKELIAFAKKNKLKLKKSDAESLKKLRAKVKKEYEAKTKDEDDEAFWEDEDDDVPF